MIMLTNFQIKRLSTYFHTNFSKIFYKTVAIIWTIIYVLIIYPSLDTHHIEVTREQVMHNIMRYYVY